MTCFTLRNEHMDILLQLHADGPQGVFNPCLPPLLEEMAAVKLVAWDTSNLPVDAARGTGFGHVSMLPEGESTLEDMNDLCPTVLRIA